RGGPVRFPAGRPATAAARAVRSDPATRRGCLSQSRRPARLARMNDDSPTEAFDRLRSRLFGIAYRMLGVRADAEDVLQDAWLRWREADHAALQSAEAWLVTVVTRLAIDRLRAAKVEREAYVGEWLPEPIVEWHDDTPELIAERA